MVLNTNIKKMGWQCNLKGKLFKSQCRKNKNTLEFKDIISLFTLVVQSL